MSFATDSISEKVQSPVLTAWLTILWFIGSIHSRRCQKLMLNVKFWAESFCTFLFMHPFLLCKKKIHVTSCDRNEGMVMEKSALKDEQKNVSNGVQEAIIINLATSTLASSVQHMPTWRNACQACISFYPLLKKKSLICSKSSPIRKVSWEHLKKVNF